MPDPQCLPGENHFNVISGRFHLMKVLLLADNRKDIVLQLLKVNTRQDLILDMARCKAKLFFSLHFGNPGNPGNLGNPGNPREPVELV